METELRSHIVMVATAYAGHVGRALTTIAKRDIGIDSNWFAHVSGGGGFTIRAFDTAMHWFAENWPSDLAWPRGVPRPRRDPEAPVRTKERKRA